MLSRFSPYLLWGFLSLPAVGMLTEAATAESTREIHGLLHPTGEWAARLLIITLMATPLMVLFRKQAWPRWFVRNRRYLGVAAFGYAVLHLAAYLWTEPVARWIAELTETEIWTGWVAFLIFVPLALTSHDWWVRKLGTTWKPLQRMTYAAAVFTLVHWAALHDWGSTGAALANFAPLIALEAYRVWWFWLRPRPPMATAV
jgi:sulfoxide reductase heme-binding subunit YedZ